MSYDVLGPGLRSGDNQTRPYSILIEISRFNSFLYTALPVQITTRLNESNDQLNSIQFL